MPRYRTVLTVAVVAVLFSGIGEYLFARYHFVPPLYWLAALGFLSAPLFLAYIYRLELPAPRLLFFVSVYLVLVSFAWLRSDAGRVAEQAAYNAVLSTLIIILLAGVLSGRNSLRVARVTIVILVLFAIATNGYDVFFPGTFSSVPGRSAGLYMNPNGAAISLVTGMIATLLIVPEKWREVFVLSVGVAVVTTLSRAGILVWFVAAISSIYFLKLSAWRFAAGLLVSTLLVGWIVWFIGASLTDLTAIDQQVVERIEFFGNLAAQDVSMQERMLLLEAGWHAFLQHPILGWGLGGAEDQAATALGRETGMHNMYLNLIVEHGFIGIVVVPLMAILMFWGALGAERRIGVVLALVFVVWAFFDHNVLDVPSRLLVFAAQVVAASRSARFARPVATTRRMEYEAG